MTGEYEENLSGPAPELSIPYRALRLEYSLANPLNSVHVADSLAVYLSVVSSIAGSFINAAE